MSRVSCNCIRVDSCSDMFMAQVNSPLSPKLLCVYLDDWRFGQRPSCINEISLLLVVPSFQVISHPFGSVSSMHNIPRSKYTRRRRVILFLFNMNSRGYAQITLLTLGIWLKKCAILGYVALKDPFLILVWSLRRINSSSTMIKSPSCRGHDR